MLNGSCLCGAIQYQVDQLDSAIAHCHCRTCRKSHAAAFNTAARVDRGHFRWVRGRERLSSFESSPGKLRKFCSICGSHLIADRPVCSYIILRVATLDEDPGDRPQFHIWTSHRTPWLGFEGLSSHAEDSPEA
jgi:ADP-ribosyl-[dinitrogen reductase] hydrolase